MRTPLVLVLGLACAGCGLDSAGLSGSTATDAEPPMADAATPFDAVTTEDAAPADSAPPVDVDDAGPDATIVVDASIDAADAIAAADAADSGVLLPGCVETSSGGRTYWFCEREATWEQARVACQFAAMDLVAIDDAAENDLVKATIKGLKEKTFAIGLTDQVTEGKFVWVDGTTPGFTSWAALEPNDFFGEDCVVMKDDGKWNDVDCGDVQKGFVCEAKTASDP